MILTRLGCWVMLFLVGAASVHAQGNCSLPASSRVFTNVLASGEHVYPGKDLNDRAHLLMKAFKPGLDDALDEEGETLFRQLDGPPKSDQHKYITLKNGWNLNPGGPIDLVERTGNLAHLNQAIHRTDNAMCLINDPKKGRIVMSTGKREPVWQPEAKDCPLEGPVPVVAHLFTGHCGSSVMRVVNFILAHPQLHDMPAPAPLHPKLLPSHIKKKMGKTYLDRALIYLYAVNEVCEFFIREGSYWEFDTTDPNNIHGWWFNNAMATYKNREITGKLNELKKLKVARKNYPNGITFSPNSFVEMGVGPRPINRALILNSMFASTAHAFTQLDELKGTNRHRKKVETYNRIVRHCYNSFRSFSYDVDEGPYLGVSRVFQYVPALTRFVEFMEKRSTWYAEDAGHLEMDFGAIQLMEDMSDLHPEDSDFNYVKEGDLRALTGTAFSRHFDYQANITSSCVAAHESDEKGERGRNLGLDEDGIPHGHPGYMESKGLPVFATFIGRYGTIFQQLAMNAKILEMAAERLRVMEQDSGVANFVLQREDTWPTYRFVYPFELKKLRETRAKYCADPEKPNEHAPICSAPEALTIHAAMERGKKLLTLEGSDADADQVVTYWIIGGNNGLHLYLDPMTGDLSLNKYYPLKEGEADQYTLKVMVSDNGTPTRYTIVTLPVSRER